jgi:hypothetical protein
VLGVRKFFSKEHIMKTLKQVFSLLVCLVFALCAMPAFASDHNGIDPIDHLQNHLRQADFWIGQGQWVVAFYQPVCISETTWQTAVTHWMFVQGGGLMMIACLMLGMFLILMNIIQRTLGSSTIFQQKAGSYA